MTEKATLTKEQIEKIFESWETDKRKNPKNYISHEECDKMNPKDLMVLDAATFIRHGETLGFIK